MPSDTIIMTHELSKRYGPTQAVDRLNLTVRRGEIYGFLGLNGAGKTTTIRLLLGLVHPTSGSVELFDQPLGPERMALFERIGSLVETPAFYPYLTVRENLNLHRILMGVKGEEAVEKVLTITHLESEAGKQARRLSTGNKQRVGLARALLAQPEVLILDEPTNGMDPAGIREVRLLLKELTEERGVTVLISSHILAEIQQMATTIGIIHHGRLLEEIGAEELHSRNRTYLEIVPSDLPRASWVLEERFGLHDFTVQDGGRLRLFERLEEASRINRALVEEGLEVSRLFCSEENLEDHFIQLTGGEGENGRMPRKPLPTVSGDVQ